MTVKKSYSFCMRDENRDPPIPHRLEFVKPTQSVSIEDFFEIFLTTRDHTSNYQVLCIPLGRAADSPSLLGDIARFADSVDGTTRRQVGFVLCFDKTLSNLASGDFRIDYQSESSLSQPVFNDRLRAAFLDDPSQVNLRHIQNAMTRATNFLMRRLHISEDQLPSILFI